MVRAALIQGCIPWAWNTVSTLYPTTSSTAASDLRSGQWSPSWLGILVTNRGSTQGLSWDGFTEASYPITYSLIRDTCANRSLPFSAWKASVTETMDWVLMKHWAQHPPCIICSINVCWMNDGIQTISSQGFNFSYSVIWYLFSLLSWVNVFKMKIDCV